MALEFIGQAEKGSLGGGEGHQYKRFVACCNAAPAPGALLSDGRKSGASPLKVVVGSIVAYDLILMVRVPKRPIVRVPNCPATFMSAIALRLWRQTQPIRPAPHNAGTER